MTAVDPSCVAWSNLHAVTSSGAEKSSAFYFLVTAAGASSATTISSTAQQQPLKIELDDASNRAEGGMSIAAAAGGGGDALSYRVWGTLVSPSQGLVWTCESTTKELRPDCLEPAAFHRLFEDALRSRSFSQATISVLPQSLTSETLVARVDVRLPAKGGKASVGIAVFNCCLQRGDDTASGSASSSHPMAQVFQALSNRLTTLAQSHALLEASRRDLAAAKAIAEQAIEAKLLSEKKLVQGCLTLLNEKKEKIRELVETVNNLSRDLQEANERLRTGGGGAKGLASDDDDGDIHSPASHEEAGGQDLVVVGGGGRGVVHQEHALAGSPSLVSGASESSLLATSARGDSDRKRPRTSTENLLDLF